MSKPAQFLSVFLHHVQYIDFACCCSSGANAPRCLTLCGSALRRWRREGLMKWAFTGSLEWPQTSRPSKLRLTPVRDSFTLHTLIQLLYMQQCKINLYFLFCDTVQSDWLGSQFTRRQFASALHTVIFRQIPISELFLHSFIPTKSYTVFCFDFPSVSGYVRSVEACVLSLKAAAVLWERPCRGLTPSSCQLAQ